MKLSELKDDCFIILMQTRMFELCAVITSVLSILITICILQYKLSINHKGEIGNFFLKIELLNQLKDYLILDEPDSGSTENWDP